MTALPLADRWFERRTVDGGITLLWEPHVIELMRCNIWHVRGRDRDLVVDTGMGVTSLVAELGELPRAARPVADRRRDPRRRTEAMSRERPGFEPYPDWCAQFGATMHLFRPTV